MPRSGNYKDAVKEDMNAASAKLEEQRVALRDAIDKDQALGDRFFQTNI